MCGIFGFVGNRDRAASIDLDVALQSLHHRGRDDRGTWFGISKSDAGTACAFAHTRLAIIDLTAAGHQPMTSDDGRHTIVYNGEIYNFMEIRAELEGSGARFHSNCDTEVVLKSFARWGNDCVSRFRGMFAFAIWDEQLGSLFLARDRMGIKPLYYTQTSSGFAFASEVRCLMDCSLAERRLSSEGLHSYLAFGSSSEPFTIVEGVLALPPGCWAETNGKDTRIAAYWTLPNDKAVRDAVDIRSELRSAIVSELDADVPVGIFLSGGIDSSAIVSFAASARTTPIHTFTVTFDESRYSEEKFAAEVARRYGCDHHQVHLSAENALAQIDAVLAGLDQPSADGVNTFFVSKAAREAGLVVTLSGLGGDEVFAGYDHFRSFRAMRAFSRWAEPFTGLIPDAPRPFAFVPTRMRKLSSIMQSHGDPSRIYAAVRGMFNDRQVSALQPESSRNGFVARKAVERSADDDDMINTLSRLELTNYVRNTLLRDADAMSMANSLEVRVPFLDHRLVESMLRIPGSAKLSRSVNKPLLVAAAGALPPNVFRRPKMGFTVPLEMWIRGPFQERVTEILNASQSHAILDSKAVADVWRAFTRGEKYMNYSRVWCLVALIAWCENNGVTS